MHTVVTTQVLAQEEWTARRAAHEARVDAWLRPHRERRRTGRRHPVEDFLFTYYSHRPARLRRWHPGFGVRLAGPLARDYLTVPGYTETVDGVGLSESSARQRSTTVKWLRELLTAMRGRPAHFGCFGLHEWAMVYQAADQDVRHPAWPLRLGRIGTDEVVERHRIRCTHHDAVRFFTPAARPRNTLRPSRDQQVELEQRGCLHANMDCYKWAYKLSPLVRSELVADCFALARDIRVVDMRASPYDLRELGYEPIAIETPEGKAAYVEHQRAFAARADDLRDNLLAACDLVATNLDAATEH